MTAGNKVGLPGLPWWLVDEARRTAILQARLDNPRLTVDELADHLGVNSNTLRDQVRRICRAGNGETLPDLDGDTRALAKTWADRWDSVGGRRRGPHGLPWWLVDEARRTAILQARLDNPRLTVDELADHLGVNSNTLHGQVWLIRRAGNGETLPDLDGDTRALAKTWADRWDSVGVGVRRPGLPWWLADEARRTAILQARLDNPRLPVAELADHLGINYNTLRDQVRLIRRAGNGETLPDLDGDTRALAKTWADRWDSVGGRRRGPHGLPWWLVDEARRTATLQARLDNPRLPVDELADHLGVNSNTLRDQVRLIRRAGNGETLPDLDGDTRALAKTWADRWDSVGVRRPGLPWWLADEARRAAILQARLDNPRLPVDELADHLGVNSNTLRDQVRLIRRAGNGETLPDLDDDTRALAKTWADRWDSVGGRRRGPHGLPWWLVDEARRTAILQARLDNPRLTVDELADHLGVNYYTLRDQVRLIRRAGNGETLPDLDGDTRALAKTWADRWDSVGGGGITIIRGRLRRGRPERKR